MSFDNNGSPTPPKWIDRFVEWYCIDTYQDEVLGDIYELFDRNLEEFGIKKAKWKCFWNAFYFMRLYNLKIIQNSIHFINPSVMWKNYLKISYRHMLKNAPYISINVVGLGLALACCIFAYVLVEYNAEFNHVYSDTDDIYQIHTKRLINERQREVRSDVSPIMFGDKVRSEIAGVADYTQFIYSHHICGNGDDIFSQRVGYAPSNFFQFFNYELESGETQSFSSDPTAVYISPKIALKYFGSEPAVGKTLYINYEREINAENENGSFEKKTNHESIGFKVAGVLKDIGRNNSFQLEIIVNLEHFLQHNNIEKNDFNPKSQINTFIRLEEATSLNNVNSELEKLVPFLTKRTEEKWEYQKVSLIPFNEIASRRKDLNYRGLPQYHIDAEPLVIFSVIALLIVLVAVFNFTNTSMALAQKRVKEIGVRKVLGGVKSQVIFQFLLENFITCALSLGLSIFFADLFMQWIEQTDPPFKLVFLGNYSMLGFLVGLLTIVSFIAGIYPALYVGSMKPASILKGGLRLKGANTFTKVLLSIQFSISFIAVFCGIVMYQNANYQQGLDIGYDHNDLFFASPSEKGAEAFLNDVKQVPGVEKAILSENHITNWWVDMKKFEFQEVDKDIQYLAINDNYLNLIGANFLQGADFDTKSEKGKLETVIINEALAKEMNIANPVGQLVKVDSIERIVVGVVQDLIFDTMDENRDTDPLVFVPSIVRGNHVVVKAVPNQARQAYNDVKDLWKKHFPYRTYSGRMQADLIDNSLGMSNLFKELFLFLAILSIVLSASGLFALMSLSINRKIKEIGIRKVLGASFQQVLTLINKPYFIIVIISWVVGISFGYFIAFEAFLSRFKYHMDPSVSPFIISLIIILVIASVTMGGKVFKAATTNPSDTLRVE